jgi:hypothetical protein
MIYSWWKERPMSTSVRINFAITIAVFCLIAAMSFPMFE